MRKFFNLGAYDLTVKPLFFMSLFLAGCGLHAGGGINTPAPNDPIISQGTWTGLNSATVSGAAELYNANPGYIIRLDGFSLTPPTGTSPVLGVVIEISGSRYSVGSLQATSGSQNYPFPSPQSGTVNAIIITDTSASNVDYARADLLP